MNARRKSDSGASAHTAKAAVLIAVGIVLGLIVFNHGYEAGYTASAAMPTSTTTTAATSTTTTSTSLAGVHPPASVAILVANATSTAGAASRISQNLSILGYSHTLAPPDNAATSTKPSVIYYQPGYQADGQTIAHSLGLSPGAAQALPSPPPVSDSRTYDILIVVGPDLANQSGTSSSSSSSTTAAKN